MSQVDFVTSTRLQAFTLRHQWNGSNAILRLGFRALCYFFRSQFDLRKDYFSVVGTKWRSFPVWAGLQFHCLLLLPSVCCGVFWQHLMMEKNQPQQIWWSFAVFKLCSSVHLSIIADFQVVGISQLLNVSEWGFWQLHPLARFQDSFREESNFLTTTVPFYWWSVGSFKHWPPCNRKNALWFGSGSLSQEYQYFTSCWWAVGQEMERRLML